MAAESTTMRKWGRKNKNKREGIKKEEEKANRRELHNPQ
jgi:hypothetical protein